MKNETILQMSYNIINGVLDEGFMPKRINGGKHCFPIAAQIQSD